MAKGTSEEAIFAAACRTLGELGFRTTVLLLDESGRQLRLRFLDADEALIRRLEGLVGMRLQDFSFAVDATDFHRSVVREQRTVFDAHALELAIKVLDGVPASVVRTVCRLLDVGRMIGSPVVVGGEVTGLVVVSAPELSPDDVPVVKMFAQQLGAALSKAKLVADLQRSMKDLEETQEQLLHTQKIEAIGLLASGVAHDFNNLLSAITLSATLVQAAVSDSEADADLRVIQESCERGAALVAQLLTLGSKQKMNVGAFDVDVLVRDLERLCRRVLGENIAVRLDFGEGAKWVQGDRQQLEQLLVNLAANARDAMPDGGDLVIRTACDRIGPDDALAAGDYVRILVSDTGTGMSESTLEKIFEPFFTTKDLGSGTGLGLSAAKATVERHRGSIEVQSSRLGRGTTFSVRLPVSEAPSTAAAVMSADESESPTGHGELVLIVEDEPLVQRSAARLLKQAGYRVITADNSAAARELVQRHGAEIGLILCDVVLPDGRGPALLDEFVPLLPDTGMLLASGYVDEYMDRDLVDERGWRFLPKPYSSQELLHNARELIG